MKCDTKVRENNSARGWAGIHLSGKATKDLLGAKFFAYQTVGRKIVKRWACPHAATQQTSWVPPVPGPRLAAGSLAVGKSEVVPVLGERTVECRRQSQLNKDTPGECCTG